jgi:hypothetical protein
LIFRDEKPRARFAAKPHRGVRGVAAFAGEARTGGLGVVPQKIQSYGKGCPEGNRPWVGEEGFEPSHPRIFPDSVLEYAGWGGIPELGISCVSC